MVPGRNWHQFERVNKMDKQKKTSILQRTLATTLTEAELALVSGGREVGGIIDHGTTTRYYWTEVGVADYGRDND